MKFGDGLGALFDSINADHMERVVVHLLYSTSLNLRVVVTLCT